MQTRERAKGRRSGKPFFMLPRDVIESQEYAVLSGNAVKLLVDLGAQYRGKNNGDLAVTWSIMRKKGWKSKDTLYRAIYELENSDFIIRTRQGMMNKPTLFALSFLAIDECGGKLDIRPQKVAPNTWRKLHAPVRFPGQSSTSIVPMRRKSG